MSASKIHKVGPCHPCENEKCTNVIYHNYTNGKRKQCQKCRARRWSRNNRLRRFHISLRASAKKRDIEFGLEPYEAFRDWCFRHSFKPKSYLPRKQRPSIDRIDETKGYEFGNIQKATVSSNSTRHNEHTRRMAQERILQLQMFDKMLDDNNPF